jgi:hypothetical protein
MQAAGSSRIRQLTAPSVVCKALPAFDETNVGEVRKAFLGATPCPFWQAWLKREARNFSPGTVRVGFGKSSLLVFAQMTDTDIFNSATGLNQRTWELGDVFEIFLRGPEKEGYVELHVTPNNQRLQLCYPDAAAVVSARKNGNMDHFLIRHDAFHSRTWIDTQKNQWFVYAEIPTAIVTGSTGPVDNTQWRFSFGRYDYTRGAKKPVISSTSPHAEADFHRHHEWGVMAFGQLNHQAYPAMSGLASVNPEIQTGPERAAM